VPAHLADRVPAVPALRALIRRRIQPFARALQPAHTPSVSPRQDSALALLYHVRVEKIRKLDLCSCDVSAVRYACVRRQAFVAPQSGPPGYPVRGGFSVFRRGGWVYQAGRPPD
jgi:hypothetical protein